MHSVYDRADKPPVTVMFNEKGQAIGDNGAEFANFISTLVKSHIPLAHEDWRMVHIDYKHGLLTTLRKCYVVDDKLKDWVLGSAHKKWRNFKADLKEKYFDEDKSDEELYALREDRVTEDDWKWLINYWRGEEAKKRSKQGKENRKKQKVMHKAGSKSYARVTSEMHKEKGYPPRRDEVFLRTHEDTPGIPRNEETDKVLKDIHTTIEDHPELLEKTIEQGDILGYVLGKEKNGYVRGIGLGPNAGGLGMPGATKLKSTKL